MQSLAIICLGVAAVCLCTAQEGPSPYNMLSEDRYRELSKTAVVLIENLPFDITENALRKLLSPLGETITSVKIFGSDRYQTEKFAVVKYSDIRDTLRAVDTFDRVAYRDRTLYFSLSHEKPQIEDPEPKKDNAGSTTANEIRIENLSIDVDKSLYVRLSSYGRITGVQIGFDKNTGSKYGIFRFSNSQEAASAVTHLNGQDFMGKRMRVFLVGEDP
ncbi:unnamed protein product [Owenia fusiformis]|uniref:RRM domain-containing protein n=1 Tax=Owenia fusiformis TaxID=6347 RepID=A0A8S4Q2D7_OWEFU|nr:unnamed protein product [Owenia fusiformis]